MDKKLASSLLSKYERDLINQYQGNVPLEKKPYQLMADKLGGTEAQLIETIKTLKQKKILTRFGPLYETTKLGGGLTLAALHVPELYYQETVEKVNAFVEVAHNYKRSHQLNMWFVLATKTEKEIKQVIKKIEETTQLKVYNFPKLKEFYIGLYLHINANGEVETISKNNKIPQATKKYRLDALDNEIIKASQSGLALTSRPYLAIAKNINLSEQDVIKRMQVMLDNQVIRRIGIVPNHYKLGLTANGMTVWDVDEAKIEALGQVIGQLNFVSHCYQRPRHLPQWRYNFFAMVHGANKVSVYKKAQQIEVLLGADCLQHDILFSEAILKKTGLRIKNTA